MIPARKLKNFYPGVAEHKDISKLVLLLSSSVNSLRKAVHEAEAEKYAIVPTGTLPPSYLILHKARLANSWVYQSVHWVCFTFVNGNVILQQIGPFLRSRIFHGSVERSCVLPRDSVSHSRAGGTPWRQKDFSGSFKRKGSRVERVALQHLSS